MTSRYSAQADVSPVVDRNLFDGLLRPAADGRGRLDAYLPAPTVQSHAAMLERLAGGDLGLVWFGGTQEGVGDISIWFSRLPQEADRWSDPVQLTDDQTRSEQNPVLFVTPTGQLWLLYTAQLAGNQDTAEVRRRISSDDGLTWGPPETLFPASERGGVFIRQPVVVTSTGRWLLPIFSCARVPGEKWSGDLDTSAVMISDDEGTTWREAAVPDSTGCVHMNIVGLPDGTLLALFRSRWADFIYRSRSTDNGETWSAPVPTQLPNNNSSLQQRLLADGRIAVIYNHSSRLDATARRENLYDEIDDEGLVEPGNNSADPAEVPAPVESTDAAATPDRLLGCAASADVPGLLRRRRRNLCGRRQPGRGRRLLPDQQLPGRAEPRVFLPGRAPGARRPSRPRLHLLPADHQARSRAGQLDPRRLMTAHTQPRPVAVVTGVSSGIGAAIAQRLLD